MDETDRQIARWRGGQVGWGAALWGERRAAASRVI